MIPTALEAYTGQIAGLTTSLLWTATALFFNAATRRLGPTLVNTTRIFVAVALLGVTHRLYTGLWIPEAMAGQVFYLALSGVIGLSIGDQALLTSFMDIGPRLSMLIMTTSPLMAALFGWVVLGETLGIWAWVGVTATLGGVAWVVLERPSGAITTHDPALRARGVVLALVGALCQAGGLLLSKQGMGHGWLAPDDHIAPQTATLIRMSFAGLGMIPIFAVNRRRERRLRARGVIPRRVGTPSAGFAFMVCGAVTGPFLGVWMSLVASDRAPLGIAQTLCSLTPILILPAVVVLHGDRVSPRAAIGAVLAVAGSALLFTEST